MNKFTKFFVMICGFFVLLQLASLSYFVLVPMARAESASQSTGFDLREAKLKLNIPFGGMAGESALSDSNFKPCKGEEAKFAAGQEARMCLDIPWIAQYIGAAYRYAVVIGSVIAVIMIMIGGILYLTGGMSPSAIDRGKKFIQGAVVGLVLLLGSYTILNAVSPNLINLSPVSVEVVRKQSLLEGAMCSGAQQQGFQVVGTGRTTGNEAEGSVANVAANERTTKNTCGLEYDVQLASDTIKNSGGTVTAGKQTCISDSCGNVDPKLKCVQLLGENKFSCKNVMIMGQIKYPDMMQLIACGAIPQALTGGFYVRTLDLVIPTRYNYAEPATSWVSILKAPLQLNPNAMTYYVDYGQLRSDLDTKIVEGAWGTSPADLPVFIKVELNNADAWLASLVFGKQNTDSILFAGSSTSIPVIFCPANILQVLPPPAIYSISFTGRTFGLTKQFARLTLADIKQTGGQRLDLNLLDKAIFSCKGGEMTAGDPFASLTCVDAPDPCNANGRSTCSNGQICDSYTRRCQAAPPVCTGDAQCKAGGGNVGWRDGHCSGGYCDCNDTSSTDVQCAAGYYCANNDESAYDGQDPCVKVTF